jgi:predicted ArsR family transcriptional regulator
MKSTREKVLHTLVTNPRSTIVEIAKSVGINSISVRHHLTSLQADGFVNAEEERHGVGRPRLVYFLTESGHENFPKKYFRLTNHLLEQMKKTLSDEDFKKIFKNMADDITEEYEQKITNLDFEEKLDLLKKVMSNEGYDIHWTKLNNEYEIQEVACPFYQIGKNHPEICLFDQSLIANMLSISEQDITHTKHGDNHCSFKILKTN